MTFDPATGAAQATITVPPDPPESGMELAVDVRDDVLWTSFKQKVPFKAVAYPLGQDPSGVNSETLLVTDKADGTREGDVLISTIVEGGPGPGIATIDRLVRGGETEPVNARFKLDVEATDGVYRLGWNGWSTLDLGPDADDATIEDAFNALPSVLDAGGHVSVSGYVLVFDGNLGAQDVGVVTVDETDLDGTATVTLLVQGSPGGDPVNEVQALHFEADAGSGTLSFAGDTSSALDPVPLAADIETALTALASIGATNVAVTGIAPDFEIEFQNDLGGQAVELITADADALFLGGESSQWRFVVHADGGDFTVSFDGAEFTLPLGFDADGVPFQAAIEDLAAVGDGNVDVVYDADTQTYDVTAQGELANQVLDEPTADTSGLTISTHVFTAAREQNGSSAIEIAAGHTLAAAVLPQRDVVEIALDSGTIDASELSPHAMVVLTSDSSVHVFGQIAHAIAGREVSVLNETGQAVIARLRAGGGDDIDAFNAHQAQFVIPYRETIRFACVTDGTWRPEGFIGIVDGPVIYENAGADISLTQATPDDQIDNYNPGAGIHTIYVCCVNQLTGDPKDVLLTGLDSDFGDVTAEGTLSGCREFLLVNEDFGGTFGGGTVTLPHEHADSHYYNQFHHPDAADVDVLGGARALVRYDNQGSGEHFWHVIALYAGAPASSPDAAEDGSVVVTAPTEFDFRHGFDVVDPGGGPVRIAVDESELAVPEANVTGLAASLGAKQDHDTDLDAIAGLTPANDDVVQRKAGAWTNRTLAQLIADLAALGTTFQPLDSDLTSLAALGSAADKMAYTTAAHTWAEAALSAFGRSLIDDADAATARTTLGLGAVAVLAAIAEANLSFTDITTGDASTSMHGLLKKLSGAGNVFMDGRGAWSEPERLKAKLGGIGLGGVTMYEDPPASLTCASGKLYFSSVGLLKDDLITKLGARISGNGATLTYAAVGLFDSSGNLVASTGDLSGGTSYSAGTVNPPRWQLDPILVGGVATPYTVPSTGLYYIGILFKTAVGTIPTILTSGANFNATNSAGKYDHGSQGGLSALPNPITFAADSRNWLLGWQ